MSLELYATFFVASFLLAILPGPIISLVMSSSIRHGARAGLLNVAGNLLGLAVILVVVAAGLGTAVTAMGDWFYWVRLVGAAYLIWLGWKLLRTRADVQRAVEPVASRGFILQGFLVSVSNPKVLLFFGAFFPQFVDPSQPYLPQIALLGGTYMVTVAASDTVVAVISSRAGAWLSERRVRVVNRLSGALLIGGGAWMAISRR